MLSLLRFGTVAIFACLCFVAAPILARAQTPQGVVRTYEVLP